MPNPDENPELKLQIKQILISAFNFQIKKIKNLFTMNKNLWKSSFDSMRKAYDHYVKAIDKKINDLITLPSVLVPTNYTNYYEEVAKYLIQNLTPVQILTSNFLLLMVLHDTICKLDKKDTDMIKSKMFPIDSKFKRFSLGKELNKNDLEENYAFCKVIDEDENENNSLIVIMGDMLYLAEIISQKFEDISNVKINKKIFLRYLEIKVSLKNEEILEIGDNSYEKSNMKYIIIHCLNADNTGRMFNFLSKQKKNCLELEYSMINSYLDELENKFNNNENNVKIQKINVNPNGDINQNQDYKIAPNNNQNGNLEQNNNVNNSNDINNQKENQKINYNENNKTDDIKINYNSEQKQNDNNQDNNYQNNDIDINYNQDNEKIQK